MIGVEAPRSGEECHSAYKELPEHVGLRVSGGLGDCCEWFTSLSESVYGFSESQRRAAVDEVMG